MTGRLGAQGPPSTGQSGLAPHRDVHAQLNGGGSAVCWGQPWGVLEPPESVVLTPVMLTVGR